MRALVPCALISGCFPTDSVPFTPPEGARTAAIIVDDSSPRLAHVLDLDRTSDLALSVAEGARLLALYYRDTPAVLQLEEGTFEERSEWSRPFPAADLMTTAFDWDSREWLETNATTFELPAYDPKRCALLGLCFAGEDPVCRSPCPPAKSPDPPRAPDPPRIPELPPIPPPCDEGEAYFLGTPGCAPVGSSEACDPPAGAISIADGSSLLATVNALTASGQDAVLALRSRRYAVASGLRIASAVEILGCGRGSVIELPPGHAIRADGALTLRNLRIEGGLHGAQAIDGQLTLRDVSIGPSDVPSSIGVYVQSRAHFERVSIEGRDHGVFQIAGDLTVAGLFVRDSRGYGILTDGGSAKARSVVITGSQGASLHVGRKARHELSSAVIAQGRFSGIQADGRLTLRSVAVRSIEPSTPGTLDGYGIRIFPSGRALLESVSVEDVNVAGIEVYGGRATLRDFSVARVRTPLPGEIAQGIRIVTFLPTLDQVAQLERVAVRSVDGDGLHLEGFTDSSPVTVAASDVTIEAAARFGISFEHASATISGVLVRGGKIGIEVGGDSEAFLSDVTVSDAVVGLDIARRQVSVVTVDRILAERCARSGIEVRTMADLQLELSAVIRNAELRNSRSGFGILAYALGRVDLDTFRVSGNAKGIGLGNDNISFERGLVERNGLGAQVHDISDLRFLLETVSYRENGSGIEETDRAFVPLE